MLGCADFDDAIGVNAWPMELHVEGHIEWRFFPDGSRGWCALPYRMLRADERVQSPRRRALRRDDP